MRLQHTTANRDEECAHCAYPFDSGDKAIMVKGDDESVYCGPNCATRNVADKDLADYIEAHKEGGAT